MALQNFVNEEIGKTLIPMKPYESEGQAARRRKFLSNAVRAYISETNGDLDKLRQKLPRLAVLSAAYYNMRYLGSVYEDDIHKEVSRFDPAREDYAARTDREKHMEDCKTLNCEVDF